MRRFDVVVVGGGPSGEEAARRVPGAAEAVTRGLDVPAVLRGRDEIIAGFDDAVPLRFLQDRGVVVFAAAAGSPVSGASSSATTSSRRGAPSCWPADRCR